MSNGFLLVLFSSVLKLRVVASSVKILLGSATSLKSNHLIL